MQESVGDRRGDRVADCAALEMPCLGQPGPRVRIPPSPLFSYNRQPATLTHASGSPIVSHRPTAVDMLDSGKLGPIFPGSGWRHDGESRQGVGRL